jgi:hypothetical protein
MPADDSVLEILREAKKLAQRYRALTGKPLGITGEVAEYEAARVLGIELTPARQAGYDAIENGRRLQIKGRGPGRPGRPVGSINRMEWDAVLLVLLDECFDVVEIHEAQRAAVLAALDAPGSPLTIFVAYSRARGRAAWAAPRQFLFRLFGSGRAGARAVRAIAASYGVIDNAGPITQH